jgi:hypothetical protein
VIFSLVAQIIEQILTEDHIRANGLIEPNDTSPSAGHGIIVLKEHTERTFEQFFHARLDLTSEAIVLSEAVRDHVSARGKNVLYGTTVGGPDELSKERPADLRVKLLN